MTERDTLLASVANTLSTYRSGELAPPTPAHVDRWVSQFTPANQLDFLREFDHVIENTFISEASMSGFLANQIANDVISGTNPAAYWAKTNLLNIQKDGQSQREMLKLFGVCLQTQCGLDIADCGAPDGDYIYLDDVIFSGGRVGNDLEAWIIDHAPENANILVLVVAWHRLGVWQLGKRIDAAIAKSNKKITIKYLRGMEIENRLAHKDTSEVLWPCSIPAVKEVVDYVGAQSKFPFKPRVPSPNKLGPFSSEAGRQVLEQEFLLAGVKIRSQGQVVPVNRPLGHGHFGLGFGATIVTYRNCPNNCPLALWWGDPTALTGALKWYPLLARKNYQSAENVFSKFLN